MELSRTPSSSVLARGNPGDPNNVTVDSNGYLHLQIVNGSGGWTASEVFTTSNLGFGTYQWQITSNAGLIGTYDYAPSNASANVPQKAAPLGMNLWCNKGSPSSGKNVEVVIQDFQFVPLGQTPPPPPVDAGSGSSSSSGGAGSNLAPTGTGALWSKNTSSAANTNRTANAAVNDGNLTTSVVINAAGEGGGALWEAAGVTWSSAQTVASAKFCNRTVDSYGNGFFESGFKLQWTTDGSTWLDSGWTASPAYPDSSAAGGQTYSFAGSAQSGVLGVRVTGQTGPASWSAAVRELQVFAPAAAPPPPGPRRRRN